MHDTDLDDAVLFQHYKLAGHDCTVTPMRAGGFRAECQCEWWNDFATVEEARYVARHHIDYNRREAKRARERARKRRQRAGEIT